jgi:hypothetical protein
MSAETIRRQITPEVRIVDSVRGICDFTASDETCDSYREVIRADGWKFDLFKRNSPFVDSHCYDSVDKLIGKVIDYEVKGRKLIERVQFAVEVEENKLARLAWRLVEAGYLRAVSVGFFPVRFVSRFDTDPAAFKKELQRLGYEIDDPNAPRVIYLEQQQVELSAVIIGANPNALAKAFGSGALNMQELSFLRGHATALDDESPAVRDMLSVLRPRSRQNTAQRAVNDMLAALRSHR